MMYKNITKSVVKVAKQMMMNGNQKRYNVVGMKPDGKIFLIVECKSPSVRITQETFDQIARYNLELDAEYLMVTNGLQHYFCKMDYSEEKYVFLRDISAYTSLKRD